MGKIANSFKAGRHWLKFETSYWVIKQEGVKVGHAKFTIHSPIVRGPDDYDYIAIKKGEKRSASLRRKTLPVAIEAVFGAGDFDMTGAVTVYPVAGDQITGVHVRGDKCDEFLALPPGRKRKSDVSDDKNATGKDPVDAVAKALSNSKAN